MDSLDYKKASTYYLIGNFFNKGISFFTVPIFTRLLSTYDYGMVTTYNSWVAIISMVIGFALHTSIRLAYVDYKEKFEDFTSSIIVFTTIASAIATGVVVVVARLVKLDVNILLLLLCMIQSYATAIIQDYNYYLMMKYKYRSRTALMILPNLISVALSIIVILFVMKRDLYMGRIVPTALVNFIIGLFLCILVLRKSKVLLKKEYLVYGLKISVPLIVHGVALNILSQSDRVMITSLAEASQTGIYSLIYNFSMIATAITSALEGVWLPWFLQKIKARRLKDINVVSKHYVNFMTYVMVCLVLMAPEVVKLLATKEYWEGIAIIPPIIIANFIIFVYTLYVDVEHYYKKTPFITINTLIAAGTNIVLNYLLIPRYGYVAAAYTTLVSYIVALILHAKYANQLEPGLYSVRVFVRALFHMLGVTVVFYLAMDNWIIRWDIMIGYILAMLVREKDTVKEFFPGLSKKFQRK